MAYGCSHNDGRVRLVMVGVGGVRGEIEVASASVGDGGVRGRKGERNGATVVYRR